MDRLAQRIERLELNLNSMADIIKKMLEREPQQATQSGGLLGEYGPIIKELLGSGSGGSSSAMDAFYKGAHEAFDKVMILNLRKAAGLPAESPHMEISH